METIFSTYFSKPYQSFSTYKGQYTKVRKQLEEHLAMLRKHRDEGWDQYMGENILRQIIHTKQDIRQLDKDLVKVVNEQLTNI